MIPPKRCAEIAENELRRIGQILSAQEKCPYPYKMELAELAACVQHHAERAYQMATAAECGEENPDERRGPRPVPG